MSTRMKFKFDRQKFANAASYLAERCPDGLTKMKLANLLYFADKEHLLEYGRPITGDRYIKMEFGPVPSEAYNLMKRDERASVEDQELFDRYLEVSENNVSAKRPPNLDFLSETNREVLDNVAVKYGQLAPGALSRLSHREPAWRQAEMNREMDYRLMFGPGSEAIRSLVEEDQQLQAALEEVELGEFLASL
jgi:uncharacterized phage-associated protein